MARPEIGFTVDASKALRDLNGWISSLQTTGLGKLAAFGALKAQEDSKKSIMEQHGPQGEPWMPRKVKGSYKAGYTARVTGMGDGTKFRKLLWKTGALFRSLLGLWNVDAGTGKGTIIVTPATNEGAHKYAAVHQFGGGHVPARPYAGMTEQTKLNVQQYASEHLLKGGN